MWFDADTGDHADEYNHAYFMDTEGGQSGAPVWVYDGTDRFTTTVHPLRTPSAGRNLGTRLNQEKFDRLTTWINGDALPNDRPDLIDDGQAFSTFSPTVEIQGATSLSTSNAVRNIGTASSGPFCVSYYASTDTTITPLDFFIGSSCDNAPLAPFGVQSFTWSGTFPSNIPAGTYWVGWIIDGTNAINEFDDTNNVAYKTSSQLTVHAVAGGSIALGAAILPGSRAVQVNHTATAFATILATGTGTATGCAITPTNAPAGTAFSYQQTNASNVPIGTPNTPATIPAGGFQTFIFALTPSVPFPAADLRFSFDCTNTAPAPDTPGVNTFLLTSTSAPGPDIVALGATVTHDGIANIPGATGTGFFSVATVNVGAGASITATVDTGGAALPVVLTLCQTNPVSGQCINPTVPGSSVTVQINAGQDADHCSVHPGPHERHVPAGRQSGLHAIQDGEWRDGGGDQRGGADAVVTHPGPRSH